MEPVSTLAPRRRRSRVAVWVWEARYRLGPNLWLVPFSMATATLVVFWCTRLLDRRLVASAAAAPSWLPEWLVVRSAADADVVLSAFLSALSTTLALVFSISVLTFSMAGAQMGPRLIRRFVLDPVTQVTLGAYLSAIVMCALTLGSVSTSRTGRGIPAFSYGVSVLMSLGCFFLLIVYVHRVAMTIQTPRVVSSVVGDLDETLTEVGEYLPDVLRCQDAAAVADAVAVAGRDGAVVPAEHSGYVQALDHLRLLDVAEDCGAVVVMARRVGHFVVAGEPLARVVPGDAVPRVRRALHESCELGDARTREQDVEFAMNQVVEIALRALSPAVNDTFTGRTCVDWLGATLHRLGAAPDPTGGLLGRDGTLRLVEPPLRFDRLLRNAFDLVRQSAADNPAITLRMFDVLAGLAATVRADHLGAVEDYVEVLEESALAATPTALDRADVADRAARARAAVAGRAVG